MEIFHNENYLNDSLDTEFQRTVLYFIKEFKDFKEDATEQLNDLKNYKLKEDTWLNNGQEIINIMLKEMMKTV